MNENGELSGLARVQRTQVGWLLGPLGDRLVSLNGKALVAPVRLVCGDVIAIDDFGWRVLIEGQPLDTAPVRLAETLAWEYSLGLLALRGDQLWLRGKLPPERMDMLSRTALAKKAVLRMVITGDNATSVLEQVLEAREALGMLGEHNTVYMVEHDITRPAKCHVEKLPPVVVHVNGRAAPEGSSWFAEPSGEPLDIDGSFTPGVSLHVGREMAWLSTENGWGAVTQLKLHEAPLPITPPAWWWSKRRLPLVPGDEWELHTSTSMARVTVARRNNKVIPLPRHRRTPVALNFDGRDCDRVVFLSKEDGQKPST